MHVCVYKTEITSRREGTHICSTTGCVGRVVILKERKRLVEEELQLTF